jgi:hypothetical protein
MKTIRTLLFLTAIMGCTFASFAGERGPMSTTAIGHISVTLISPAALTEVQNLQFNKINLRSEAGSTTNSETTMGSIKVIGNNATYSVTVSNQAIGFNQNGKNISIDDFSATTSVENSGTSNIYIGGMLKVSDQTVLSDNETTSPLAVTVNYN